jgi:arylformamidase
MNQQTPQSPRSSSLLAVAGLAGLAALPLLFSRLTRANHAWIDITAGLNSRVTPVYPGNPALKIEWTATLAKDGVNLSRYSMGSHTGTHVDAPLHFIPGGASIDRIDLRKLNGPARVVEVGPEVDCITAAVLKRLPWKGSPRILFKTRNSAYRLLHTPTFHESYVAIAPDAAKVLAKAGVEMVGVDYLSVQPFGPDTATHTILLGKNVLIVEGLDLTAAVPGDYDLMVLPLKIVGHEAAPARALLRKR